MLNVRNETYYNTDINGTAERSGYRQCIRKYGRL